jgi:Leucine-rich repeat (LRR) protein
MKYKFVLFILLFSQFDLCSQENGLDTFKTYRFSELTEFSPDTIYSLDLSRSKLKELPVGLKVFIHLKALDLSKNNLNDLPSWLGEMDELRVLNLAKNDFVVFPIEICRLIALEKLIFNRNNVDRLPDCIGYCKNLQELDFWDTPIFYFPDSFFQLKNLKTIDLQGIKYSPDFQEKFRNQMATSRVLFDAPCDCFK